MKRDMNLIRRILEETEQLPYKSSSQIKVIGPIDEYDESQIYYHVEILSEAGLIKATQLGNRITPLRLTWEGHEFLEASRNETIWNKALEITKRGGGVVFEVLKPVLFEMVKDAVTNPKP